MTVDPVLGPGRRLYEEARKLRRVTAVPTEPGKVLQFPNKKEVE